MKGKIIGLTGGVATGKSVASHFLEELGAFVVDADEIAREIITLSSVEKELKKNWPQVYGPEGLIRKSLRQIIFFSPEERLKLNQITHPVILEEILKKINAADKKISIIVAPLLIETGLNQLVDETWVINCSEEVQLNRLMSRDNMSKEDASRMIASQLSSSEKLMHANHVIENNGTIEEFKQKLKKQWESLIREENH